MSVSSAKARRSLTEQFEMLYGHSTGAATTAATNNNLTSARSSARSPSGINGDRRAVSPQHYRPSSANSAVDGVNSFAFLHEMIRNHSTELELERRTREAAVRDLSARTTVEVGELREMIKQLRNDNNALKEQVWSLERRKATQGMVGVTADNYFGGATALANVQMPLIPRVTDLETSVEQLRQKVTKLQSAEKAREEALQKSLVDQQMQQRETLDQAKEFARAECDRREASRIDPLENQVRDLVTSQQDTQRSVARIQSEASGLANQVAERLRANEDVVQTALSDRQGQAQLEEWKRLMKASAEVEADKVKSMLSDLKADINKAIRKQEAGDLEVQDALQSFISQRVDVVRAEMLPREEITKLNSVITSIQKDTDRAADAAQGAKVAAEEVRREISKRIAALEADESALSSKLSQLGNEIATNAQSTKAVASTVDELRANFKASQNALSDNSDRITSAATKQFEQAGVLDSLSQEVSRLKAIQSATAGTESTERQQLKERLHIAEDEVKTLKSKLSALDESHIAGKKDADRALNDLKSTLGAEERANNQIAQQKILNQLATVESRLGAVDERCAAGETSQGKLRDELLAVVRAKVDDVKEIVASRLGECDEVCKARQREVKEQCQRAEEKVSNASQKLKSIENAVAALPTTEDLERAVIEARDAMGKAMARQHQEHSKEESTLREDLANARSDLEKAIADLSQDVKAKASDTASKAVVEEMRIKLSDVATVVDQNEATMMNTIQKAIKDRLKPVQDAQNSQKEEFDEFQSLMAELAQRLKVVVATVEEHSTALKDHEKAIEASDKSTASVYNELMLAVSVACSHDQQFGPSAAAAAAGVDAEGAGIVASQPSPNVTIKSMGDVVQYILNYIADAQQEQNDHLQSLERIRSASQQTQQPPVTEEDVHMALQTVSGPLMELTKIVDRHEIGFSTIHELVQGIRFNNKSILAVAKALGVETDGLKLRTLDDSELQEALTEAANDTREREYEITEKERHWM